VISSLVKLAVVPGASSSRMPANRPFPTTTQSSPILPFQVFRPLNPFGMNTCISVSKQTTLTPFDINTYAKVPAGSHGSKAPSANARPAGSGPPLLASLLPCSGASPFATNRRVPACRPFADGRSSANYPFTRILFELSPIISTLSEKHGGWIPQEDSHFGIVLSSARGKTSALCGIGNGYRVCTYKTLSAQE